MKSFYSKFSLMFMNCLVAFVGVNLLLLVLYAVSDRIRRVNSREPARSGYGASQQAPGSSQRWTENESEMVAEHQEILKITSYDYDSIAQLRPRSFHGRYVNIEQGGFRRVRGQAAWPPNPADYNIFVFGGSTAFGLYLDDYHTIPSRLQEFVRAGNRTAVNVYNFGRPGYTSTQELLLYLSLLRDGHVPALAIFLDGLNDCLQWTPSPKQSVPWPDTYVDLAIQAEQHPRIPWNRLFELLPMSRLAQSMRHRLGLERPGEPVTAPGESAGNQTGTYIINRWAGNKRAIEALSAAYGVKAVFVWQPVAAYKYDLTYGKFMRTDALQDERRPVSVVYPAMEAMAAKGLLGADFLDLAGVQQGRKENLYLDSWHYDEAFSKDLAARIFEFIQRQGMLSHRRGPGDAPRLETKSFSTVAR